MLIVLPRTDGEAICDKLREIFDINDKLTIEQAYNFLSLALSSPVYEIKFAKIHGITFPNITENLSINFTVEVQT